MCHDLHMTDGRTHFPVWEIRREAEIAKHRARQPQGGFRAISLSEMLAQAKDAPLSSVKRLNALSLESWDAGAFTTATRVFLASSGFAVRVYKKGDSLPRLSAGARSKYFDLYSDCVTDITHQDDLVVAVVSEGERVLGFANIENDDEGTAELKLLSVDEFSTRISGVASEISIDGQPFSIGIGHVLVDALVSAMPGTIQTDATTPSSQYIFTSLGFERSDARNPCLLRLAR